MQFCPPVVPLLFPGPSYPTGKYKLSFPPHPLTASPSLPSSCTVCSHVLQTHVHRKVVLPDNTMVQHTQALEDNDSLLSLLPQFQAPPMSAGDNSVCTVLAVLLTGKGSRAGIRQASQHQAESGIYLPV